jgi:hypothetical protein
MKGTIVYQNVLLDTVDDQVFLEVHPDAYGLSDDPYQIAIGAARLQGVAHMVDWTLVREVIRKEDGIARNVTRR